MYQESVYIDEQLNTKKRNTHSLTHSLLGKIFSSDRITFFFTFVVDIPTCTWWKNRVPMVNSCATKVTIRIAFAVELVQFGLYS